jgi:hypothetical protein
MRRLATEEHREIPIDPATRSRARSGLITDEGRPSPRRRRLWALAGVGAALTSGATVVTSSMASTVYEPRFARDVTGLSDAMVSDAPVLLVFHVVTVLGAILAVVFAAGLHRRLSTALGEDGTLPLVAFAGMFGTAVVSILGSGLDTEFVVPMLAGDNVDDSSASTYAHWIGTIPWVWVLSGLTALSLHVASRRGVLPRWLGRVGLIFGVLILVLGVSPLQYMAIVPGVVWLLVTSLGLLVGDRDDGAA